MKKFFTLSYLITCFACVLPINEQRNVSSLGDRNAKDRELSPPVFNQSKSFIEKGPLRSYGLVSLSGDFTGILKLRGQNIHRFLQQTNNSRQELCLLARFPQATGHPLLLLSLVASKQIDPVARTLEHYYLMQNINQATNSQQCSTLNLSSQLNKNFPQESMGYLLNSICPTTCPRSIASEGLRIYHVASGSELTGSFNLRDLRFQLAMSSGTPPPHSSHPSCRNDRQCQALSSNYNCCLEGQCVVDGAVRRGVDQSSSSFGASQQSIALNPAHIARYPQFYYSCPQGSPPDSGGQSPEPSPKDRLLTLRQLYQCTSPPHNEEGLCTITYQEAGPKIVAGQAFHTRNDARDFSKIWSGPKSQQDTFALRGTIWEVTYGAHTLYDQNHFRCMSQGFACYDGSSCTHSVDRCPIVPTPPGGKCHFNSAAGPSGIHSNDNTQDSQCVVIKPSFASPRDALHDRLEITYRVDGKCQRVNSFLAKCEKHYVQGQFDPHDMQVSDHSPGGNIFAIPSYADTTKQLRVFVDGIQVFAGKGADWGRQSGNRIAFSRRIFDGQRVRIEYFVDISGGDGLLTSQDIATTQINSICGCQQDMQCRLTPVMGTQNGVESIVDYACRFPPRFVSDPPLEQTAFLDSRSVPVRYYDVLGHAWDQVGADTPTQDGRAFRYINNNPLQPNNVNSHVGFNEIYGTLSAASQDAKPPLMIPVKAQRTYNIFVNTGQLSSCINCGRDYYSALNRVFPDAFGRPGGGLLPDPTKTSRFRSSGHGSHLRSDDLLFGRACFVPASMLAWSHRANLDINLQRRSRQAMQHFLFANGLQRDWYGFDYGSVIGSFDGVRWFAVGHGRQVKSESNRLYLAINAYFGDLTARGGYTVRINESVSSDPGLLIAKSDGESSGAQCQRYHQCQSDRDCITQLGWDYVCENILGIKTPWPLFDKNALELPDSAKVVNLAKLLGGYGGSFSKRCIYRGRGAICHPDYQAVAADYASSPEPKQERYASSFSPRINGCTANHWCAAIAQDNILATGNALNADFNSKLMRFATASAALNASRNIPPSLKGHRFGLGAKVAGRPLHYHGKETLPPGLLSHIRGNKIKGLCLPGRNLDTNQVTSYGDQHAIRPRHLSNQESGDMVGNIGMTETDEAGFSVSYYNSCPILDDQGELLQFATAPPGDINSIAMGRLSSGQSLTSNALKIFAHQPEVAKLLSPFVSIIDIPALQESRCLRAAGSACFTDLDCGPSPLIHSVLKNFEPSELLPGNSYEAKYWQEELTCAQRAEPLSASYDLKQNVCCRGKGKKLTIGSRDPSAQSQGLITHLVAGYDDDVSAGGVGGIALDSLMRNTRTQIIFADTQEDPMLFPPLQVAKDDNCPVGGNITNARDCPTGGEHPLGQFNTFGAIAERTCCTGHWVREFHPDNGGGHHWLPGKMQSLDKTNFACLNYNIVQPLPPLPKISVEACLDGGDSRCDCSDVDNEACYIRSIPGREGDRYNKFFSSLELTGIPQVLIQSDSPGHLESGDPITCLSPPTEGAATVNAVIPETIKPQGAGPAQAQAEFEHDTTNLFYYKASDANNFHSSIKQIFSPDEVSCCIPPGSQGIIDAVAEKACCSGRIVSQGGVQRCCLEDYTNVTVFFNRYVSSMLQDLPASQFDPFTGRPLDRNKVRQIALSKNVCCSGRVKSGRALSSLRIPTAEGDATKVRRFIQGNGNEDNLQGEATLYDFGRRWNTDIYCVP